MSTEIDATKITTLIVSSFAEDFLADVKLDVAVVGAGPAGLTTARLLAAGGYKVALFERNLYVGGGIWGGGMLLPRLVVQEEAKELLEEVGISLKPAGEGYYVADSVETVSKCTAAAIDAGAHLWVGMIVEDVMIDEQDRVCGVVLNWGAVEKAQLHVDPLAVEARVVIDATGHDCDVLRTIERKIPGAHLATATGGVVGERSMNAALAEAKIAELTREFYPGVIAAGMAVNAVTGTPRMGPIFGGMFLSGQRAAQIAADMLGL